MLQDDDRNLQFLNHAIDIKTNVLRQALHRCIMDAGVLDFFNKKLILD